MGNCRNVNSFFLLLSVIIISGIILGSCNNNTKEAGPSKTGNQELDAINSEIYKDSTNHQLIYQRAKYFYESEDYDACIADLVLAIDMDSSVYQYYHLLSDAYLDYFKSRDALQIMVTAADLFPRNIPTLLKLAETQHILKLYEESLMTIARLLTVDDQNAEAYFMMGLNFRSVDQIDRAINAFQTATELDPELIDAWLILGKLFENKNDPDAIKYYDAAINVNPQNPVSWHSKAYYLQNNGKVDQAISIYKEINLIDRNYLDAYLNAGILYMNQDSFNQAFEQFDILANLKTENFIAYYYRALAYKELGNIVAAKIDLQNCLNLNPDYAKAKKELLNLNKTS